MRPFGDLEGPSRQHAEILTLMRFQEREWLLPVGVASLEVDDIGRQMVVLRLALTDRPMFLLLWDLLAMAGMDPRTIPGDPDPTGGRP